MKLLLLLLLVFGDRLILQQMSDLNVEMSLARRHVRSGRFACELFLDHRLLLCRCRRLVGCCRLLASN